MNESTVARPDRAANARRHRRPGDRI